MRGLVPLISHSLIALAVVALLALISWAGRQGRPRSAPGSDTLLLRYNVLFRWFAYAVVFGIPAGLTVAVYLHPPRAEERWYVLGLYLLFAALTLPLVWEASRYYLLVSPAGLEARSAWRGTRFLAWDDIDGLSYSSINSWFVFSAASGERLRVSAYIGGLKNLLALAESRLPVSAIKAARTGYAKLGRPFPSLPDEPVLEARSPR
ncbi:MAG TPA: PH domain-containing protein [Gemmataceae bacterium]|nr:PH domain-containing protein [Gemmataceae bacterium]